MKKVLSVDEVAEELGLDKNHVQRLCRSGKLGGFKITPKNWRVSRESLDKFIEDREKAGRASEKDKPMGMQQYWELQEKLDAIFGPIEELESTPRDEATPRNSNTGSAT